MMVFYFGPWGEPGHYIWSPSLASPRPHRAGPWTSGDLDATPYERTYRGDEVRDSGKGVVPVDADERQGVWRLTRAVYLFEPWTAIGAWDRTCDPRRGSKAVFVAEGEHDEAAMREIAARVFPELWSRITGEAAPGAPARP